MGKRSENSKIRSLIYEEKIMKTMGGLMTRGRPGTRFSHTKFQVLVAHSKQIVFLLVFNFF